MHSTMWNSLCTGKAVLHLSASALSTCESLRSFIDDAWARYQGCGYGCETAAGADERWGWSNLRAVPRFATRVGSPAITHIEVCHFVLGPIRLGYCPDE